MHFTGHDDRGLELHVIMIPDDRRKDAYTVIQAMPIE